jgi:ubiquinol-cytochrome c reductase iron-sulfur subunit
VKAERLAAGALIASMLAGLGLAAVYVAGGEPQLEGILLFVSLSGLGGALIVWGTHLLPGEREIAEPRHLPSPPEERRAATVALEAGAEEVARRRFLVRLLLAAAGALGLAALFPIRSLGPSPGRSLLVTAWRAGVRLVDAEGRPIRAEEVEEGNVRTVFPEGAVGSADAQALLIRVAPGLLRLPAGRRAWAPGGLVVYSKVCTHAGCPVGLYLQQTQQLQCPCHQSTFDVLEGARPVFGPAARPLPQLPIGVDAQGYLVARGDFPEPVGPGFWGMP